MNSDDIYKFIGYAAVIIVVFCIASKSLNFQLKVIEGLTDKEGKGKGKEKKKSKEELSEQEERDKQRAETEKQRLRKANEKQLAEDIKQSIIREIHLRNNKNLEQFEIIDKLLIEEYNTLITNYIAREKIQIFNLINDKNKNITFGSIINELINKCEKIESLTATIDYLAATSGKDLQEEVEKDPNEKPPPPPPKETEAQKKKKKEDEETRKYNEEVLKEKLKGINEDDLEYNNEDIENIAKTESELKNRYIELLNAYKTEEIIFSSDLMLSIGENQSNQTIYTNNMNEIKRHNKNIRILTTTETILTELFGGGVDNSKLKKKGGKEKNIKKK